GGWHAHGTAAWRATAAWGRRGRNASTAGGPASRSAASTRAVTGGGGAGQPRPTSPPPAGVAHGARRRFGLACAAPGGRGPTEPAACRDQRPGSAVTGRRVGVARDGASAPG